jgi:hypothetical protein
MAFVPADLDIVEAALKSGVKRVTFADGRTTEYNDARALLEVRRAIETEISLAARSAAGIRRKRFARFGTGL